MDMQKKDEYNFSSLWVNIRILNRTLSQLASILEKNYEKSKYEVFEILTVRSNNLIDCLSRGIALNSKKDTEAGSASTKIMAYQKLINSLVDITLMGKFDIVSNEVGLINECIGFLNAIENDIRDEVKAT